MKVADVLDVIKGYHQGGISESEAVEELRSATFLDLYLAQVEMYEEGYEESDIKDISKLYLNLIHDESVNMIQEMEEDHPLRKLMVEHNMINSMLLVMDKLVVKMKRGPDFVEEEKIDKILENLDELKKHIRREEELIFPLLNQQGYAHRTLLLASDHSDFMDTLDELKSLKNDHKGNSEKIIVRLNKLIYRLRDHAFIENDMFYPLARKLISRWSEIKRQSEKIGYCEFKSI